MKKSVNISNEANIITRLYKNYKKGRLSDDEFHRLTYKQAEKIVNKINFEEMYQDNKE